MPRKEVGSCKRTVGDFAVTPWQRKRPAAPRDDNDLYAEVAVPVGMSVGDQANDSTIPVSDTKQAAQAGRAAEPPAVPRELGPSQDHGGDDAISDCGDVGTGDYDADLDGPASGASLLATIVPTVEGAATVAVLGSPTMRVEGHVRDKDGNLLLTFTTQLVVRRQECTRDDDWSLHLLSAMQPSCTGRLQFLVELTGEHAVRLRAPPSVHGQEEAVAASLQRLGGRPHHEAVLSFDCDQLHSGAMASEVVRSEGLRVFEKAETVAVGW
eukprot:CAMPEP_0206136306 /NCGR_PEP_ID=MMETSP1473-20131121/1544_1 /ASSEMBLY_ACC=CAM_ASM_001109 /TAXON_ID=1461547 /ORGANISM="Stichococcus sp, Strain RCC1054" /LENGTH=267 /DNA_ID=CAMNT_0053528737 /DNA_START=82 /DNA_END=882 /DNA_ORIENTATION=+